MSSTTPSATRNSPPRCSSASGPRQVVRSGGSQVGSQRPLPHQIVLATDVACISPAGLPGGLSASRRTKTLSMGTLAMACPLGLSVATLSPDLDSDQDGSGGVAAVTPMPVSGTSVSTSQPGGQGVAQSA